jgi:hypothetical protein
MSKVSDFIDTLDLDAGGTYRGNCPVCGGTNTFTVSNEMGNLLYNCYKAGCNVSGSRHVNMDVFTIKALLSSGMYSDYASESYTEALQQTFDMPPYLTYAKPNVDIVNSFYEKWSVDPDDTYFDVRQDRIVFVVRHGDRIVDAVGRALYGIQPKWLRYGSSPVPFTYPFTPKSTSGHVGVIVEDAISAYVLHKLTGAYGIALLGTQLTPFHKWYIPQYFDSVIVALDPDALDKTMSIIMDLGDSIPSVRGLNLNDDLKYANEEDIDKLKEMINGN